MSALTDPIADLLTRVRNAVSVQKVEFFVPYSKIKSDIVAILKPAFGNAASITEQTDAWVRFDVSGNDLPSMFERLCAFDLRSHGTGSATRTVIDHLGCYIVIRGEALLSVIGPRSSARSLHHALVVAAQSAFYGRSAALGKVSVLAVAIV